MKKHDSFAHYNYCFIMRFGEEEKKYLAVHQNSVDDLLFRL